jgi:Mg-chelatase subunit ChlD
VLPGQTYTYPLSIVPVKPGFTGTVRLTFDAPPGLGDLRPRIEPDTVTLGRDAQATLTVTMPPSLPEPWKMAVRGTAGEASATLCIGARERRTGTLKVTAELGKQAATETGKNLLVILDLSGSMNLALGKSTRIATARQVLRDVLQRIPDDFKVGLRLYGHRFGSRQKETCTDSELRIPLQPLNRAEFLKTIDTTRPRGETPLVYSVLQAIGDLKSAGGGSVVLITDGEESCGGDFAQAAAAIKASGLDFRLDIVGFTLSSLQARQQLGTLTASTGGAYYAAADGPALTRALVAATINRFPYTVYDASGAAVAHGEAGDRGQELNAGTYRVVVQAGDDRLTIEQVSVGVGASAGVRVVRKSDGFVLEQTHR